MKNIHVIGKELFITSDEEIKKDDYYLGDDNHIYCLCTTVNSNGKKIILTTNADYIEEGIQAIDEEFLEWFVNNPSCEKVEIESWETKDKWELDYKIIIPKEEPKQIYYNTVGRENGVFAIKGQFNTQKEALDLANELNEKGLGVYYDWNETLVKEKPKQETLEEISKHYANTHQDVSGNLGKYLVSAVFQDGAKYQAERMYSEEDMKLAFNSSSFTNMLDIYNSFEEFIGQYKKK